MIAPIPGVPGYAADREGRIWSIASNWRGCGPRILQASVRRGYHRVRVVIDGKCTRRFAHRLVALAFLGPQPSPEHEVRHLNGNRGDNRPENLAWGTRRENVADSIRHGTQVRGERQHLAKLTADAVREMRASGGSVRSLAARFGVHTRTVQAVLAGETWRHVTGGDRG